MSGEVKRVEIDGNKLNYELTFTDKQFISETINGITSQILDAHASGQRKLEIPLEEPMNDNEQEKHAVRKVLLAEVLCFYSARNFNIKWKSKNRIIMIKIKWRSKEQDAAAEARKKLFAQFKDETPDAEDSDT